MSKTDEQVLRGAIAQLLIADLTHEHGWREGVSFHMGLPLMEPDMTAGESLVQRGVVVRSDLGCLTLTEPAVVRALRVAVDAAVRDLLTGDPPAETFGDELAEDESYTDEDNKILVLAGVDHDRPGVRSW